MDESLSVEKCLSKRSARAGVGGRSYSPSFLMSLSMRSSFRDMLGRGVNDITCQDLTSKEIYG
jgi:hypothetical protein